MRITLRPTAAQTAALEKLLEAQRAAAGPKLVMRGIQQPSPGDLLVVGGTDFENINTLGFPNRRLVQSLALNHRFGRSVSGAGLYSNRRSNRLYENPAVPPTSAMKSGELSDPGATRPGAFMPQLCFANTCFVNQTDLGRAFVCNAAGGGFWRRL